MHSLSDVIAGLRTGHVAGRTEAPSFSAPGIALDTDVATGCDNSGPDNDLFVRRAVSKFGVMDDDCGIWAIFDTFEQAENHADDTGQVIRLTGTAFVRA